MSGPFFFTENLTDKTLHTGSFPWDFVFTETITDLMRTNKKARDAWYHDPSTRHQFYTMIEPVNPNLRPSQENPPHAIRGFPFDYDNIKLTDERINEVIAAMKLKPSRVERSLGGFTRMIFNLEVPLIVGYSPEFCTFVQMKAVEWLGAHALPGLDEGAATTFSRLLCNGGVWRDTGFGPIPKSDVQAFFVKCGLEFFSKVSGVNETTVPLDIAEKALREKFPSMTWPSDFVLDSSGPTFWVPDSTSPMSAIVKKEGMFTFSDHAPEKFASWTKLLGAEFVSKFAGESMAKATEGIYYDSKNYYHQVDGVWSIMPLDELLTFFKVSCRLSARADKDGLSPIDKAKRHIHTMSRIRGAVPVVGHTPGLLRDDVIGTVINTWENHIIQPAPFDILVPTVEDYWFIEGVTDCLFPPDEEQTAHFKAWSHYAYKCAVTMNPQPGQVIYLGGEHNSGKTLICRNIIGTACGGYIDAGPHIVDNNSRWNDEMFIRGFWCIDDDTCLTDSAKLQKVQAILKKYAANNLFNVNTRYQTTVRTKWAGRITITINLDFLSAKMIGNLDNSSGDKVSLFKCSNKKKFEFPTRPETLHHLKRELPIWCRRTLEYVPPSYVKVDNRYGFESFHHPDMLQRAKQTDTASAFRELLIGVFRQYFADHPDKLKWEGTSVQLTQLINSNPMNESVTRAHRMEQFPRYLERFERSADLGCKVRTGEQGERIWSFPKFGNTKEGIILNS